MSYRRPLTPWAVIERLERVVSERREARMTWETSHTVLEAMRAYVANPKREELARIICLRTRMAREVCPDLCRKCLELGGELKSIMRGEPDVFGDRGWYDGGHRLHDKKRPGG